MQETEVKLIMMSEVPAEKVSWLWYPYIPFGKITIVRRSGRWQDNIYTCSNCSADNRSANA